jgi:hypothetical protein
MRRDVVRALAGSAIVCLTTWVALLAAGNVGLQRSISKGALTLFEQPFAVALVVVTGLAVGFAMARWLGVRPLALLVGVLLGDALAGLVLAPIAIGELEPIHAPLVFAAVSVVGLQPLAALAGAVLGHRSERAPAGGDR